MFPHYLLGLWGFFINGSQSFTKGRHGHDRVLVAFTTTYAITAYHRCEFASRSWRGILDTTLCDKVCL
jgi:hypothetical protein